MKQDTLRLFFSKKNNNLNTEEGRNNERLRRMSWTSIAALFAQGLQMLIPLITVRITLAYMGEEIYALWTTVNSLFSLMMYADMGLGNGLQTKLSQETGRSKTEFRGKIIVSSTYAVLCIISFILAVIFAFSFAVVDWPKVVGVQNPDLYSLTVSIVLAIIIPKIISIPLSLVRRCQNAMQDGYVGYFWQGVSSILSLLSIYIVIGLDLGPAAVIFISSCIPVVIYVFNSFSYYKKKSEIAPNWRYIETKESKAMLKIGIGFFVLSLLNAISLNMDNYIVAHARTLTEVTPYSIALRATQLLNVACTVLSAPLWAANGEALARGDVAWIKKTTKKMSFLSVLIVFFASIVLLTAGPYLFDLWVGYDIQINRTLLLGLLLMQLCFAFISPYFMVLNASGRVKIQIVVFGILAPMGSAVKFFVCKYFGTIAMNYCAVVLYFCIVLIPIYISVKKQLRNEGVKNDK